MSRESFVGIADTPRLVDTNLSDTIFPRYIHGSPSPSSKIIYTILTIFVSALIFIAVVAAYDLVRAVINSHYKRAAESESIRVSQESENYMSGVTDPKTIALEKMNTNDTLFRIVEKNTLRAVITFTLICIISALILVPYICHLAIRV